MPKTVVGEMFARVYRGVCGWGCMVCVCVCVLCAATHRIITGSDSRWIGLQQEGLGWIKIMQYVYTYSKMHRLVHVQKCGLHKCPCRHVQYVPKLYGHALT